MKYVIPVCAVMSNRNDGDSVIMSTNIGTATN